MTDFPIHTIENTDGRRRTALEAAKARYKRVPNVLGAMATSPEALEGYLALTGAVNACSFTPTERHVVWFAINRAHGCHYCMAAHTPHAVAEKVPGEVIAAMRDDTLLADTRLEELRGFTTDMVVQRGSVNPQRITGFLSAGFTQRHVFEIILTIAQKVMTNYTNHIVEPPLDVEFEPHRWTPPKAVAAE